jgi:hypothetical protein
VTDQQAVQYCRVLLNSLVPQDLQVGMVFTGTAEELERRGLLPRFWAADMLCRLSGVVSAILPGLLDASACATCSAIGATA